MIIPVINYRLFKNWSKFAIKFQHTKITPIIMSLLFLSCTYTKGICGEIR